MHCINIDRCVFCAPQYVCVCIRMANRRIVKTTSASTSSSRWRFLPNETYHSPFASCQIRLPLCNINIHGRMFQRIDIQWLHCSIYSPVEQRPCGLTNSDSVSSPSQQFCHCYFVHLEMCFTLFELSKKKVQTKNGTRNSHLLNGNFDSTSNAC